MVHYKMLARPYQKKKWTHLVRGHGLGHISILALALESAVETLPEDDSGHSQRSGGHGSGGGKASRQGARGSLETGKQAAELLQNLEHFISTIPHQNEPKPQRNRRLIFSHLNPFLVHLVHLPPLGTFLHTRVDSMANRLAQRAQNRRTAPAPSRLGC